MENEKKENQKAIQNVKIIKQWVDLLARWGENPSRDVPLVLDLLDDECEWFLMATNEHFKGKEAIMQMSLKSAGAIKHTEEHKLQVTNLFASEGKGCLEYVHRALLIIPGQTKQTAIEMPICIVFQLRNGKILKAKEYYEIQQMYGASNIKPLYTEQK